MPCILCGSQTRAITHPKRGVYLLCPHCELITLESSCYPSEEEAVREYSLHENSPSDPRYISYFTEFIESSVLPFAREGRTALDFGSGPAPVLAQLLQESYGYDVDCYDPYFSPEKIYVHKEYDLITSTEVVEHLSDPLSVFRLFASLLAPTGILSVMTLLHHNDDEHFLRWHYIRERSHIAFYSLKTLASLASLSGLSLLYSDGIRYACFGKKACP